MNQTADKRKELAESAAFLSEKLVGFGAFFKEIMGERGEKPARQIEKAIAELNKFASGANAPADTEPFDPSDGVAPCGLLCYTCPAFDRGVVRQAKLRFFNAADALRAAKGLSFSEAYQIKKLKKILDFYAGCRCPGCRALKDEERRNFGCMPNCPFPECNLKKGSGHCAECEVFPCATWDNPAFSEEWKERVEKIRAAGLSRYFEEERQKGHYEEFSD